MPPPTLPLHIDDVIAIRYTGDLLRFEKAGTLDILDAESRRAGSRFAQLEVPKARLFDACVQTDAYDPQQTWLRILGCFQGLHEAGEQTGHDLMIGPLPAASAARCVERLRSTLALPRELRAVSIATLIKNPGHSWIDTTGTFTPGHSESPDFEGTALMLPRACGRTRSVIAAGSRLRVRGCLLIAPPASVPYPGMGRRHRMLAYEWEPI